MKSYVKIVQRASINLIWVNLLVWIARLGFLKPMWANRFVYLATRVNIKMLVGTKNASIALKAKHKEKFKV
jgi:hypothetical protein